MSPSSESKNSSLSVKTVRCGTEQNKQGTSMQNKYQGLGLLKQMSGEMAHLPSCWLPHCGCNTLVRSFYEVLKAKGRGKRGGGKSVTGKAAAILTLYK